MQTRILLSSGVCAKVEWSEESDVRVEHPGRRAVKYKAVEEMCLIDKTLYHLSGEDL